VFILGDYIYHGMPKIGKDGMTEQAKMDILE